MAVRTDLLLDIVAQYHDQPFVQSAKGALTYRQFYGNAVRLLNFLIDRGVRRGDHVVVSLENRTEYLELVMALALGGMVMCPVDPAASIQQLNKVKQLVNASYTITAYSQLAYALDDTLPDYCHQGELDDPFLIVFSSGTTGMPKGIVQSFGRFFQGAARFAQHAGKQAGALTLHNWPMFYNAGLFNLFACPFMTGGRIWVGERFTAKQMGQFWQTIREQQPDIVYLSPTMMASLSKTLRFFPDTAGLLQHARVISTSSILYPAIRQAFQQQCGATVYPCFGITELGGSFTVGDAHSADFSVGQVMPGVKVSLAADDGELLVSTPYMALGYLNPSGGIDRFDPAQPFCSGDLATLAGDELIIHGRKKDVIKKGGENIHLVEIEEIVQGSGYCVECYAVGKPDVFWGETYDLFFTLDNPQDEAQVREKLMRLMNDSLPQALRPEHIVRVDEVPRTASGKPMKRLIRYTECQ